MNYSKWLLVTLSALAVAACGGDGDNNGGGGNGGGNGGGEQVVDTNHAYYTLDYVGGDWLSAHTTVIPHFAESGVITLGNSSVEFDDDDNGGLVLKDERSGYRYLFIGDDFTPDEGGLVLCRDNEVDGSIYHAILPADSTAVGGTDDDKLNKLKGKKFQLFASCELTDEIFAFNAEGNVQVEVNGSPVPGETATAADVKSMLSTNGWNQVDDGDEGTTWMRVYEDGDGRVFMIMLDEWKEPGGTFYDILILVEEESQAV
ncbi:MAG: hypothetical protein M0Q54_01470 [Pigmentiphaga sp.]|nr:hypothetical protein [Pigmentiphaga sp.]